MFCAFVEQYRTAADGVSSPGDEAGKRLYLLIDVHPIGIVSVDGNVIMCCLGSSEKAMEQSYCDLQSSSAWEHLRLILSSNEAAHAFYRKHSFQETGNRKQRSETLFQIEMKLQDMQQRNTGGTYGNQISRYCPSGYGQIRY